jgi:hypothetical protein
MKRIVLFLACLAIMPLAVQAGELFRWVDKAGKMNYGDLPPADATDIVKLKYSSNTPQNGELPEETRRALQNFPVTLYVGDGCGETCEQARTLLGKRGVPFSETLLRTRQDVEAFKQLSGIDGVVPVLGVGKDFLKGFSELLWNNELDIAGYPKTARSPQGVAPPVRPVPFTAPATPPAQPAAQ